MNLFKWINELFVGKRDWDSFSDADKKSFSPFMVIRYLSMGKDFLPLVNHIKIMLFKICHIKLSISFGVVFLPKKKTYLKYIKGKKDKFNKEIIDYLVEYFEVSRLQASEYISIDTKDSMKDLLREFGKTEKEIKKKLVR